MKKQNISDTDKANANLLTRPDLPKLIRAIADKTTPIEPITAVITEPTTNIGFLSLDSMGRFHLEGILLRCTFR